MNDHEERAGEGAVPAVFEAFIVKLDPQLVKLWIERTIYPLRWIDAGVK